MGDTENTETPVVNDTLSPEFNHSKLISFPSITDEHLEWFESGCITFSVYGKQVDTVSDQRLLKMTTKVKKRFHLQYSTAVARPPECQLKAFRTHVDSSTFF